MPVPAPRLLAGIAAVSLVSSLAPVASAQSTEPLVKISATGGSAQQQFGESVDVATGLVIAGAPGDNPAGNFSGSAYLFDAATSDQLFRFTASDGQSQDQFGSAVSVYADHAIVGAPNANAVYVYDTATGDELRILTPSGSTAVFGFGQSLDLFGDIAIIASPPDDGFNGAVYLFDVSTGDQLARITAPVAAGQFGAAVAIHGDRAVVGAPSANEAYLYGVPTGSLVATLFAPGSERFGASVAIDDRVVLVGDPQVQLDPVTQGRVWEFTRSGGARGQFFQLGFGNFGAAVAISGAARFAGAGIFNEDSGSPVNFVADVRIVESNLTLSYVFESLLPGQQVGDRFGRALAGDGEYLVVGAGSNASNAGAIYVGEVRGVASSPVDTIVNQGETVSFSAPATTDPTFQWRRDGVDLVDGGDISGATTDTLQIANADGADIGVYDCVVTFANGPQTTAGAILAVIPGVPDCLGDTNGDGVVDLADLNAVLAAFGQACP
ncbi:MAG: immunoglobulin domain-containing protein [Phycisphaerales bacterium]